MKARFAPECKWRLVEEYGSGCFAEEADGMLLFSVGYTNKERLLAWILGFGNKAELLEPAELREELAQIGRAVWERYREKG